MGSKKESKKKLDPNFMYIFESKMQGCKCGYIPFGNSILDKNSIDIKYEDGKYDIAFAKNKKTEEGVIIAMHSPYHCDCIYKKPISEISDIAKSLIIEAKEVSDKINKEFSSELQEALKTP